MFLFYVLSIFKKGDTIQGGTLFKGGHYLRKYGICDAMYCCAIVEKGMYVHIINLIVTQHNSLNQFLLLWQMKTKNIIFDMLNFCHLNSTWISFC